MSFPGARLLGLRGRAEGLKKLGLMTGPENGPSATPTPTPSATTLFEAVFRSTPGANNGYTGYGTTVDEITAAKTFPQTSLLGKSYGIDPYDAGVFADSGSGDTNAGGLYTGEWIASYNGHFLKINLGIGTFKLYLHAADGGSTRDVSIEVWQGDPTATPGFPGDAGTTKLATIAAVLTAGQILDASGQVRTAANFAANQQPLTISPTTGAIYLTTQTGHYMPLNWTKVTT